MSKIKKFGWRNWFWCLFLGWSLIGQLDLFLPHVMAQIIGMSAGLGFWLADDKKWVWPNHAELAHIPDSLWKVLEKK